VQVTPTLIALTQDDIDVIVRTVPGGAANVQDVYPLAPPQEGILFHRLLNAGRDAYVLSTLIELESAHHADALIGAVQSVIDRHDILRTAVLWEQTATPVQIVYRNAVLPVERLGFESHGAAVDYVRAQMAAEQAAFDLRRAPLVRLLLATGSYDDRCYALLQVHHIACDDRSWRMLIEETTACFEGRQEQLPAAIPYRTYVERALAHSRTEQAWKFFRSRLGHIDEPTAPFGVTDVYGDGCETIEASHTLDLELAHRLRLHAHRLGVSAARLFHAAWGLVVAHSSGRDEIVYGTVLLTFRQKPTDARRMLGISINTLPLRLQLQGVSAEELVRQTDAELRGLLHHQYSSLTMAQRCCAIEGAAPLFTALLNYRHRPPSADIAGPAPALRIIAQRGARTNYPVTLAVDDLGDGFVLTAQADQRIDPARLIMYAQTALRSLVSALHDAPQTPALTLGIIPESERRTLIERYGMAQKSYATEQLIHETFEEQVRRAPHAVAAVHETCSLTYGKLNAKANQLAWYLRSKGAAPDRLVGICVERGLDMIVGLIGILKAGAAYLPLDPNYPGERLHYMIEDASPAIVLIQEKFRSAMPPTQALIVAIDRDWSEIALCPDTNPLAPCLALRPDHLAYVIYTSGSTGKPKGVLIEHRNVTRLFAATEQWFAFNEKDVWTLFHSYAFDFSVWELWGALLYGGRVIVVPYPVTRSAGEFYQMLCDNGVTVLNQTPSAFAQLIDAQARSVRRHSLRLVIFGGEALDFHILKPWVERNGAELPQLVNMYGITETTVHVTYRRLSCMEIQSERGSVIGQPIPDLALYLLDGQQQLVPVGVVGEIYVGGAGVARGYLNRAALTAERFVADPFDSTTRARLYRSGDLGRRRADGTLEYVGRNDDQVKIRGFRIELGEVQAHLARHSKVKDVVVVARCTDNGAARLVAYIVPVAISDTPSAAVLRAHLKTALPEYMVPSAFVTLAQLPLTSNGKLDRRALPEPDQDAYAVQEYAPPEGAIEQSLAGIWRELLAVERISRHDNFFDIGGHSLLAMQVVARIQSLLSVDLSMRGLFNAPSLKELAAHVMELSHSALLQRVKAGAELDELLDKIEALSEDEVASLLQDLTIERAAAGGMAGRSEQF
jgi:amino acid adenylation domain-containing protein